MLKFMRSYDNLSKSRNCFVLEGITAIGQFSLTYGAFLAGFINLLGGSDQLNGMVAVTPAAAGILQILSPLVFERLIKRKRMIVILSLVVRLILSCVYFVPILVYKMHIGLHTFIIMYVIAFSINAILTPVLSNWIVDVTPIEIRGKYLAMRERISLFIIAVLTILLGRVLDITKLSGSALLGFVIVGIVLVVLGVLNLVAVINAVEVDEKNIINKYTLKEVLTVPLKDKTFRKIIYLFIIWNFALQIGVPFMAVYLVTSIKLTYTYILANSVISTVVRVIFASLWGKIADQKSWFLSTKLSIFIIAIDHILWGFVTSSNYIILVPILHILGGFAWGGISISLFNIQFLFSKREGRTMYLGLNAAIGGVFSLFAVWIGGIIVKVFEGKYLIFLGLEFSNMQIVFLLSGLFTLICPIIVHFFIEPSKTISVENN